MAPNGETYPILMVNPWNTPEGWTARWTGFLFFATALLWAFTALMWWTTRRAVRDQEKVSDAALRSAKAAEVAADAALAALDRPWLVIEDIDHNELDWLECKNPLVVIFRIANYGRAPAFIKSMRICHFRGPDQHNWPPPWEVPATVVSPPEGEVELNSFLYQRGNLPRKLALRSPEDPDADSTLRKDIVWTSKPFDERLVLDGGAKTDLIYVVVHSKLPALEGPGLNPMGVTQSYFMGIILYEMPAQSAEVLRFSYSMRTHLRFSLFKDYPPYNERKKATGYEDAVVIKVKKPSSL